MKQVGLFAGIGGFEYAASLMGWETVAVCEIDKFCQKILSYHFPKSKIHGDIKTTDFTIYRGQCDILTGGFPCQPYSVAGKRKGKDDERHLFPEMLRAIREIQPRWVVGENVFGLVNWNGGLVFDEVQADLEAEGYEVQPFILPACAVNAPHRRDRVWFVAYRNSARLQETRTKQQTTRTSRSSTQWPTPHPNGNGLNQCNGNDEKQPGEGGEYALSNADTCNEYGDVTDTGHTGLQGSQVNGSIGGIGKESDKLTSGCVRSNWQNFPTQSPVCGRNDGVPDGLDGITFSKWRNESIKAYGNAIVPQVVLQIYKAIEFFNNK